MAQSAHYALFSKLLKTKKIDTLTDYLSQAKIVEFMEPQPKNPLLAAPPEKVYSGMPSADKNERSTSFKLPESLYQRFKNRVPRHGDRSAVLRTLVEKFLNNEVVVITKPRRI